MTIIKTRKHLAIAIALWLSLPIMGVLGAHLLPPTAGFERAPATVASTPGSESPASDSLAKSTPKPAPTISAPPPASGATTAITCTVGGEVYQMTQEECEAAQWLRRRTDERERQRQSAREFVTLEDDQIPLPSFTPITPTSTPVICDAAAKASLEAEYQRKADALYREYQAARGRILASGAVGSSALQAAYAAYLSQVSSLQNRHQGDLAAIHC